MNEVEIEFEIYRDLGEGAEPVHLAAAKGIENAIALTRELARGTPGCYLVWDPLGGQVIMRIGNSSP
jgi:hypothetical protein